MLRYIIFIVDIYKDLNGLPDISYIYNYIKFYLYYVRNLTNL